MYIEKKVNLNNNIYFVVINVTYKKNKYDFANLELTNSGNSYYDDGNLSILIKKIERQYSKEKAQKYNNHISFMDDILYIYDRIPILNGIKSIYLSKENSIDSITYISNVEIKEYIYDNNINMYSNCNFRLDDELTWYL